MWQQFALFTAVSFASPAGDFHLDTLKVAAGGGLDGPLTAEPEVVTHTLAAEDEFLLLGCDGLWDVLSSQRAVDIARSRLRIHNDPAACSRELVRGRRLCRRPEQHTAV